MIELSSSGKSSYYFYISSPLLLLVPCALWKWRNPIGKVSMNALTTVGRVITCGWLRYEPQDEEEVYDELLQRSTSLQNSISSNKRGSVASAVAKFEQQQQQQQQQAASQSASSPSKFKAQHKEQLSRELPTCSQKAKAGAAMLFGLWKAKVDNNQQGDNPNSAGDSATAGNESPTSSPSKTFRAKQSNDPICRVCQMRIFPTEESTTCRHNNYHTACFRCTLCGSKLKNHPDEQHEVMMNNVCSSNYFMFLQCRRCKLENEQKYIPRESCHVAGEKIIVEDEERGDIEQVVETIGDDLAAAIFAMIPRCATCGGDFLKYKGEISIVGSLKYHKECFLTGRPSAGKASFTLDAVQAAKYLPENFIVRLCTASSGKVLTTLFFVWNDKDSVLKSMRSTERQDRINITFVLDDAARANPNYRTNINNTKKTRVTLPSACNGDENIDLTVDLVGGDQVAPQAPRLLGSVSIASGYQRSPLLQATIGYSKYNLQHTLLLNIPCNVTCDVLELLGATLTVKIQALAA